MCLSHPEILSRVFRELVVLGGRRNPTLIELFLEILLLLLLCGSHPISDLDECISSPCVVGATCLDMSGHYECQCPPGYEGVNCGIGTYIQFYDL